MQGSFMARYQKLFNVFGPTAIGQIAAAVVIGALIGFGGRHSFGAPKDISPFCFIGGGGAIGLVAGLSLILVDAGRKRVAAGTAKPRGTVFWVIVGLACAFLFLAASIAYIEM
jgi:hypothetical protein